MHEAVSALFVRNRACSNFATSVSIALPRVLSLFNMLLPNERERV